MALQTCRLDEGEMSGICVLKIKRLNDNMLMWRIPTSYNYLE